MSSSPLLAIVGETASGKSALALRLAERFNGELICADSRTIYKGLDIGTAKPTVAERAAVPHWLLDVVAPNESFSAAQFQRQALAAIADITARGKLPILVGGSGLYVDSVLFNYQFLPPAASAERARLNSLSVEQLQQEIADKGLELPENAQNKRHLTRLLETDGAIKQRDPLRPNTLILQIDVELEDLQQRITQRMDAMFEQGFIEEARQAAETYGWAAPGLQAPGYKAIKKYLQNEQTLEEAKEQFVRNDMALAKRQRTWFKRNQAINHICNYDEAVELTTTFLNKLLAH